MRLTDNILDARSGPDMTAADAAEIEQGTVESEDLDFELAAKGILDRVRGDVRAAAREETDQRIGEYPTASGQEWRPFGYGIAVGAGLVYLSQIVGALLSHISR